MSKRTKTTIADVCALVIRDYIDNDRASTYIVHLHIKNQITPRLGNVCAQRMTGAVIENYKDERLNQDGAARATINLELSTIRRGMKLGLERGLHSNRLVVKLYPIGNSNRRTGFFENGEYDAMLLACNPDQADILRFANGCGWRRGDILSLTWSLNYDAGADLIRIFNSKNGKGRSLPLAACPDLHDLIQKRLIDKTTCPYIFKYKENQYNAKTFNRHWHTAREKAGVARDFHDTRRTVVRNLTRAGVHRVIAKAITGHVTDSVFERYDIVSENDISGGLEKLTNYRKERELYTDRLSL